MRVSVATTLLGTVALCEGGYGRAKKTVQNDVSSEYLITNIRSSRPLYLNLRIWDYDRHIALFNFFYGDSIHG
jgi:hypothetical protein